MTPRKKEDFAPQSQDGDCNVIDRYLPEDVQAYHIDSVVRESGAIRFQGVFFNELSRYPQDPPIEVLKSCKTYSTSWRHEGYIIWTIYFAKPYHKT